MNLGFWFNLIILTNQSYQNLLIQFLIFLLNPLISPHNQINLPNHNNLHNQIYQNNRLNLHIIFTCHQQSNIFKSIIIQIRTEDNFLYSLFFHYL